MKKLLILLIVVFISNSCKKDDLYYTEYIIEYILLFENKDYSIIVESYSDGSAIVKGIKEGMTVFISDTDIQILNGYYKLTDSHYILHAPFLIVFYKKNNFILLPDRPNKYKCEKLQV